MTTIEDRFLVRGGTAAAVAALNEIPLSRELVIETDTGMGKEGDGVTHYNSLPYTIIGKVDFGASAPGYVLTRNLANNGWILAAGGGGGGSGSGSGNGSRYTYTDAVFGNVSSLLHFEGADGSTTITDQISGNVWTAAGATISTAWSSAGSSSSLKTSAASTAMVSMPTNSRFNVGNGDWTLEMTVKYLGPAAGYGTLFQTRSGAVYAGITLLFSNASNMMFTMGSTGSSNDITQFTFPCDVTPPDGASILIQRQGLIVTAAVNRVVVATKTLNNNNNAYYNAADTITVGGTPSRYANVYVDEFRFTNGQALLTFNGDFTPGTPPFPDS